MPRIEAIASMEPWHFSHGEPGPPSGRDCGEGASMEPWHFSHGEPPGHDAADMTDAASMEPWHFSHGEGVRIQAQGRNLRRFNGAMAF